MGLFEQYGKTSDAARQLSREIADRPTKPKALVLEPKARFDRTAYQREYMRRRREKAKQQKT